MDESQVGNVLNRKPDEPNPATDNQITPSTPEQVQVVQGQPETPAETSAQPDPVAPETPTESSIPAAPIGYNAFTDDEFKNAYQKLCTQMGREFGIRHDLVTVDNITDTTKFKNVLVIAKKA